MIGSLIFRLRPQPLPCARTAANGVCDKPIAFREDLCCLQHGPCLYASQILESGPGFSIAGRDYQLEATREPKIGSTNSRDALQLSLAPSLRVVRHKGYVRQTLIRFQGCGSVDPKSGYPQD